ncbi:DUF4331 domain-containing protein [Verrucomicrobiaceae bacterium 227]
MKKNPSLTAAALVTAFPIFAATAMAANHREAPITALDHKADITDVFAFRSYDGDADPSNDPQTVTLIMCVDPLLEPGNGPNYFPFDDEIMYEIKVDNNNDAEADLTFQIRFNTEQRLPNVFTTMAGVAGGANAPANSPNNLEGESTVGSPVIPDRIDEFSDGGLGQIQTYTVTMIDAAGNSTDITTGAPRYAVPANVGPRTMDYEALFSAGTYSGLGMGISSFAGTVDDPFYIDLGGAFDTLNLTLGDSGVPGVLTAAEDSANSNFAPNYVAGYAVNAIAIEVPNLVLAATTGTADIDTTLGIWATTSRPRVTVRRAPFDSRSSGTFRQIQRMGNPLVNELVIGTGMKNRFSMDQPLNDAQFAPFVLDPVIARVANAAYGGALGIPDVPRLDLLPLVQYVPPFTSNSDNAGPIADLLRLTLAIPATPVASANRLGFIAGDTAGFPNGRRLFDDVTDIALRVVVGGVLAGGTPEADDDYFTAGINDMLGDGVNVNDAPYRTAFPYLGSAPSGNPDSE